MANNIKVVFHGTKAPSGKTTEITYMISSERKKQLDATKMFDMEVLNQPKAKATAKGKKKKDKK